MTGRRGHGEGSIHRRSDGRWAAVVDLGWQAGKRRRKYVYGATRREVVDKLRRVKDEVTRSGAPSDDRITVEAYVQQWLDAVKPTVRASTYSKYESAMRRHVVPTLGKQPLSRVTPQQVTLLYRHLLASGLSPRSVVHVHRILHRALEHAVRWGIVGRNVLHLVDPPRVPRTEMTVLDPKQVQRLLAGASGRRIEGLLALAVTTGLRQGELFALRWSDVDLNAQRLTVQRALVRAAGGGTTFAEPKTATSNRQVQLSTLAVDALRRHWRNQQDDRRKGGELWNDLNLVFTSRHGNPLNPQNLLQREFYPLLEQLALPKIRFHDLRHTAATLLLAAGIHPKIVSEMLGHTDVGITLNLYSHVIPGLHQRAAQAFDTLLASQREQPHDTDAYDGPAPASAALAVNLAVRPSSSKAKAQVSPRSSGDRASVS